MNNFKIQKFLKNSCQFHTSKISHFFQFNFLLPLTSRHRLRAAKNKGSEGNNHTICGFVLSHRCWRNLNLSESNWKSRESINSINPTIETTTAASVMREVCICKVIPLFLSLMNFDIKFKICSVAI